tara:strand:+ start:136 stop:705 length:570 start_codon:yes stop_codon:yes gene_type:complete
MGNNKINSHRISLIDQQNVLEDKKAKSLSFFCKNSQVLINDVIINELKEVSRLHNNANCRVCLHNSPESLHHDMIILETKDSYLRPHKHIYSSGETFHVIEGEMGVFTFDDKGNVSDSPLLQKGDVYRVPKKVYHALFPISEYVIYHENKVGPFLGQKDNIYADWSPEKDDLDGVKIYKKNHLEILNRH